MVVRELGLQSEAHRFKEVCKLPDSQNPLGKVNHLCFLLKEFLRRHNGFDRGETQGWLDLFSAMMNPPESKMEKVAMILDRAMAFPKTVRNRDYYGQNSRSAD